MRRYLGLAFVLGMFACARSAMPITESDGNATTSNGDAPLASSSVVAGAQAPRGSRRAPAPLALNEGMTTEANETCANDVTLHGDPGAIIPIATLSTLFWGGYWSGAGASERGQYDTAWKAIGNDPAFYARLAEYSTPTQRIQAGSWSGSSLANGGLVTGATVTEAGIHAEILAEIASGAAPRAIDGRIYIVMLPPGVTSEFDQQNGFVGHHNQFVPAGATSPIRYVVITYNPDQTYNDPVISHEVSESITDPDLATGWWDQNSDEVGDICRFNYVQFDGFTIEKIYSMKACSCVGPTSTTTPIVDAGVPDTSVVSACTAATWNASATYPAGSIVQYAGKQYTSAFWNQNAEPDTHTGGSGTGEPWLVPTACGTTTTTCAPACSNKQCGSDGCGGSCGSCVGGSTCTANSQCVATCVSSCNGKQCGGDGCGGTCGACSTGQTCATDGTCHAPTTTTNTCGNVTPWNPNQPWYGYAVGEQHTGSNGHKFTCKNVAYCIDDPTGYVGGTYGWTDNGPC